ncbi:hypothetical protein VDGL01_09611 [Verticillium dahliae]
MYSSPLRFPKKRKVRRTQREDEHSARPPSTDLTSPSQPPHHLHQPTTSGPCETNPTTSSGIDRRPYESRSRTRRRGNTATISRFEHPSGESRRSNLRGKAEQGLHDAGLGNRLQSSALWRDSPPRSAHLLKPTDTGSFFIAHIADSCLARQRLLLLPATAKGAFAAPGAWISVPAPP